MNSTSHEFNATLTEVEEYWDKRPCNIRHSDNVIGTKEYFLEVSERRFFVEPHIREFMAPSELAGKNVLELGCGIGTDAALFAESGANYSGIELSSKSLEIAKNRFSLFDLQGKFIASSIEDFQISRNNFASPDLVYSFGVLHHTVNPLVALKNIVSQCKNGTEFRIMLYASNSYKYALIKAGVDQYEAQNNCPIAFTYTKQEAITLMEDAGLKVSQISQDHIFPYNVDKYKQYIYEKEPWFECMPPEHFKALKDNFGWHLLINAWK
jgi:2-polyprenyl-3-methyl-5-hydroxy-6-metoxy-1,4-benzoquinol methylase